MGANEQKKKNKKTNKKKTREKPWKILTDV